MATLDELVEGNDIEFVEPGLRTDELPERYLYIDPNAGNALNGLLESGKPTRSLKLSIREQVVNLIREFSVGSRLYYKNGVPGFNNLRPRKHSVWELKTEDVRLFGWFVEKDTFIIASVADATNVKKKDADGDDGYGKHIQEVVSVREKLDLNPPKFIPGIDPKNVVSNFTTTS